LCGCCTKIRAADPDALTATGPVRRARVRAMIVQVDKRWWRRSRSRVIEQGRFRLVAVANW